MSRLALVVGYWSSILTTAWIVAFDIAIALGMAGLPTRLLAVGTSLLLAVSFVALMASVHTATRNEAKVWTQIGLSIAIVYAAVLIWNYYLQLTVVRFDPQQYGWLSMEFKPETAFWALETIGYTLMSLAALFIVLALRQGSIRRAIKACLLVNSVLAIIGSVGYVLTGNPLHVSVLISLAAWSILLPIATGLLAVALRREQQVSAGE